MASTTFLQKAYLAYFGRPADASGLITFANVSEAQVISSFSASAESQEFFGSMPVLDQINTIYNNLFNRDAEPAGLLHWATKIQNGELTLAAAAMEILKNAQNSDVTAVANKVAASAAFTAAVDTTAEILGYAGAASIAPARAFLAAVSSDAATLTTALAGTDAAVTTVVAAGSGNVGQTFMLTAGFDDLSGNLSGGVNDHYVGTVENNQFSSGNRSTFNPGDAIDGGTGSNTLRLFMGQGSSADGVAVSNIQTLDLRLNASSENYLSGGWQTSELVMTDWDDSLEQINIISNKSSIDIIDQQVIADVSISDQSISNSSYSTGYGLGYAAGVVDGAADGLSVTLDNVNGSEGATVNIDDGIEQLELTVADRAGSVNTPNRYASDVNLNAKGVTELNVDAGRAGQKFTLSANIADGADFNSTAFAGNMMLDSANIETAAFGAGSDTATFSGVAESPDASYNMGEGDNTLNLNVAFAGKAMAGAGKDTITASSTVAGSSISTGNGVNAVTIGGMHAGAITAGADKDTITANGTSASSSITAGNGDNKVTINGAHAGAMTAGTGVDTVKVNSTTSNSSIQVGAGDNTVQIVGEHSGAVTSESGNDTVSADSTEAGAAVLLDLRGQTLVAGGKITLSVSFVVAEGVKAFEQEFTLAGANASAIRTNLIAQIDTSGMGDLFGTIAAGDTAGTILLGSNLRLPELAVSSSVGTMSVIAQFSSSINVGAGDNSVVVTGENSGVIQSAGGNDNVVVESTTLGSLISAGAGDNLVVVGALTEDEEEGTVTIVGADNNGDIVTGAGNDDIVVGATGAHSTINAGDGDNRIVVGTVTLDTTTDEPTAFAGEDHTGSILSGSGDDQVWTASVNEALINVGDGTNTVTVEGNVVDSDITFGNGDDNSLLISGDLTAAEPGTITFGNGDNKTLTVGGDIISESVVMGTGTGSTISVVDGVSATSITVAGESTTLTVGESIVEGSSITLGNGTNVVTAYSIFHSEVVMGSGEDTLTLQDGVYTSNIQMGGGKDTLTLGADEATEYAVGWDVADDLVKTVVDMGAGDDSVMLKTSGDGLDDAEDGYIYTNGFVQGGDGADALTFEAQDSAKLIVRDLNQIVTLDFQKAEGEVYILGEKVKVTFTRGTETFEVEHTVSAADFIQGPDSVTTKVAQSVANKLNASGAYDDHFELATAANGVVTIESKIPHEDFIITSAKADVQVEQNSDARITSFETLNLVMLDGETVNNDTTINADFDMIDGTENVNLDSQVELKTVDLNDNYATFAAGGETTFELDNLKGGEAISVSGHEASATGNRQVVAINVASGVAAHTVGDILTVMVDGVVLASIVVETDDLLIDSAQDDANTIAAKLKSAIEKELGSAPGWTVEIEDNIIYMVGDTESESDVQVKHEQVDPEFEVWSATDPLSTWDVDTSLYLLEAGDVITVTVGDQDPIIYEVTQEDCDRKQAEHISEFFAAEIGGAATAQWGVVNFGDDTNVLITREIRTQIDVEVATVVDTDKGQSATSTDDTSRDVVIVANLGDDAENTTMDLTVAGHGNFDLEIRGEGDFTDLELTLGDAHSHYIDTRGDQGDFSESITVADAAGVNTNGQAITLDYVLAHTVTSTSAADLTIDQYITRDGGDGTFGETEDYAEETITVSTAGGDDHLTTLAQSALNEGSSIDLGAGENRLTIGWGEGYDGGGSEAKNWFLFSELASRSLTAADVIIGDDNGFSTGGNTPFAGITLQDHFDNRSNGNWDPYIISVNTTNDTWTDLAGSPPDNMIVIEAAGKYILLNSDFEYREVDLDLMNAWEIAFSLDAADLQAALESLNTPPVVTDYISSSEIESIGGMDYSGNLAQLDIITDAVLDQESTTLTMPGGVDNVEVLTFTDLETTDESSVASDLTIVGAANNFSIESDDDFELGLSVPTVAPIGGTPGISNLTYDSTVSDDGATTPFTDALSNPSGTESATEVAIGNRIKGATYVSTFAPGTILPIPDTFNGTGDNRVDNEQMEVYYGTYDALTGIFTVTLTPFDNLPDPSNAPTHTLVLYDNDPIGQVGFVEGLVFAGFFEEDGWTFADSPAPGENFVSFDTSNGQYVPFDDGNGSGGSGVEIGVLTVSGADGVEITGDLSVTVDNDVNFNLGNKQLSSLTVDAGDNVNVYVFANDEAEIDIGSISLTSSGNEFLNLSFLENTGTDIAIGSIEMMATAGEDSAAPNLMVSGNSDTVLAVDSVNMQAGISHDDYHDTGVEIDDNLRTTVTMAAMSLSSVDADVNVLVSSNTTSTVNIDTLDIESGCYAELVVDNNVDSDVTVSGNVTLAGNYWANLEIDNNNGTNVSMAADGVVSLMSCDDNIDVSITGNLNEHDPFVDGPDLNVLTSKSYSVTLGDLVLDAGTYAYIDVSGNEDDTYFGDLTVTIGDVDVVAYDSAGFDIDDNLSTTVVVGNVNILSGYDSYIDIDNNNGLLHTTTWGNQTRQEIDYADITLGNLTVESTDSYVWMDIDENEQAEVSVGHVSLTGAESANFDVDDNDSRTDEYDYDLDADVTKNAVSKVTINVESVTLVAGDSSDFLIEDHDAISGFNNDSSDTTASIDISIGNVDMTAGTYAYFDIDDNDVDTGEDGSAEMTIEVGDVTLNASEESGFAIENNDVYSEGYGNNTASLNITLGALDMTSGALADYYTAFEVEGLDTTAYDGGVATANATIASVDIHSDNYTYVYIYYSDAQTDGDDATATTTVAIGSMTVDTADGGIDFGIDDNDSQAGEDYYSEDSDNNSATIDISVGAVSLSAGEDNADISIDDNEARVEGYESDSNLVTVTIEVESATLTASLDANFDVLYNDAYIENSDDYWDWQYNNKVGVGIAVGAVEMTAGQDADLYIYDNDAYDYSAGGEDNDAVIYIDLASVKMTADRNASFAIENNDAYFGEDTMNSTASVDVAVGDVIVDAKDNVDFVINNNDATSYIPAISFYNEATVNVTTGDVTIDAGNDVFYYVDGTGSTTTEQGDITIVAGLNLVDAESNADVGSDVYFNFVDVYGTENISIEAKSQNDGDGNIFGYVEDAHDLVTLTLTGTNAELYLTGTMGPTDLIQGTFTLDLSGMTGKFGTNTTYDPLGDYSSNNADQDDGTYVVTVDADFDNDLRDVVVKIGTGDLIYNAQHSNFVGEDSELVYSSTNDESDWGSKDGWFSLGSGLDLDPVRAEQTIDSVLLGDAFNGDDGEVNVNDLVINVGSQSYVVTWDGEGVEESDFVVTKNGYGVLSGRLDELARELGGSRATISFNETDGSELNYVYGSITFEGPSNGYAFSDEKLITGSSLRGTQYFYDNDGGSGEGDPGVSPGWQGFNYDESLLPSFVAGEAAADGLGNAASEVFSFVGTDEDMDIGEVVIGGFRPNGFFVSGEQDRLDFSSFADISNPDDLIITIEKGGSYVGEAGDTGFTGDTYGYFDDVIIDFVNQDYGSIRLVGVGEYFNDNNVNGIANSIIFA